MAFPISALIDFSNSIICAYCSYQLYKSFKNEPANKMLLYFSQAYLSLVFSYLFFSIPRLAVPDNSFVVGLSFVIAQAFLYVGLALFSRITASFISGVWSRRVFVIILLIALGVVVLSLIYFGHPEYNSARGITNWNINPAVGVFSSIIFAITLVPSALFFLWQGTKSRDATVKIRSILIGCGLLLLIITAYTYYTATTSLSILVSDLFSLFSYIVIFVGVIYRRNKPNIIITNQ